MGFKISQMAQDLVEQSTTQPVDCSIAQELAIRGIQRRSELPQRRSSTAAVAEALAGIGDVATVADCPRFVRRGACLEFNARGRCSYHHPLDAHIVETPRPRCPQVRFCSIATMFDDLTSVPNVA